MAPWWSVKPTSLAEEDQPGPVEQLPEGDWLDRLWADEDLAPAVRTEPVDTGADTADTGADTADTDADEEGDGETEGRWFRREAGYWPRPTLPALPDRVAISPRTRRLAYNASAAGVGWWCGLTPEIRGWIEDCGRSTSIGGALTLGGGICLVLAVFWDSRTRHWMPGLAWVARLPLASALTALALYAPASQY